MFKKNKENRKKKKVEPVINQYEKDFLNYYLNDMKGRKVQVSYHSGILNVKKELNGEQIILRYPLIEIEEWIISLKNTNCSVIKRENETVLIIFKEEHSPMKDQTFSITF